MIYLDLDGCFADFFGALKNMGLDYERDPKATWAVVQNIPNFFNKLPRTTYAEWLFQDILTLAQHHGKTVKFLTALPLLTGHLYTAEADKKRWVARELRTDIEVICATNWRYKKELANESSILIDDSPRNVVHWCNSGGVGICHFDPSHTIKTLELLLQGMDKCCIA